MSSDKRAHPRQPIRLKVVYKSARSLVTAYTSSVSKGGCLLETSQPLTIGTRFVFEMYANGSDAPVEVEGQVSRVQASEGGTYQVGIQYLASKEKRDALERVLSRILADHQFEKVRAHPRIPVNLIAKDGSDPLVRYLIRDLSRGGLGLRLPDSHPVPSGVKVGTHVKLAVTGAKSEASELSAEVVWIVAGRPGFTASQMGLRFATLTTEQGKLVAELAELHRPQSLTLSFVRE